MVTLCRKKKVSYEYYKVNIREDSDPDPGKTPPDSQQLFRLKRTFTFLHNLT